MDEFWSKVAVGGAKDCWPFTGARSGGRSGKDYGLFSRSRKIPGRRSFYAHRFAFCLVKSISIDDLPADLVVRHQCDNPVCCNPIHLELGTQADNARDMAERGRSLRGERATRAILTEAQVLEVRSRLGSGEKHADIAASYGVCRSTVSQIARGAIWGWLDGN